MPIKPQHIPPFHLGVFEDEAKLEFVPESKIVLIPVLRQGKLRASWVPPQ